MAYEPIERDARGAGVVAEPNSSLAGGPLVSAAFSGLVTALAVTSLTAVLGFWPARLPRAKSASAPA